MNLGTKQVKRLCRDGPTGGRGGRRKVCFRKPGLLLPTLASARPINRPLQGGRLGSREQEAGAAQHSPKQDEAGVREPRQMQSRDRGSSRV